MDAARFDALLLSGEAGNPDRLRQDRNAVRLMRAYMDAERPVAAIWHGPWMLVEADGLNDRTVTSWESLRTNLRTAGGTHVDQTVVRDGTLIASRKPDDVLAFNGTVLEAIGLRQAIAAGTWTGGRPQGPAPACLSSRDCAARPAHGATG